MNFQRFYGGKILGVIGIVLMLVFVSTAFAGGDTAGGLSGYIDNVQQTAGGMTLGQIIETGGFIMLVLVGMSVLATALIFYNFLFLNLNKLAPKKFAEDVMEKLERGDSKAAQWLCHSQKNVISKMVNAGFEKKGRGHIVAREAMEGCIRKEIGGLWQNISYLSDIATIAPLIGLLGTVIGMIQAFNVIAFQTAVVKPVLLAGGVSKAMVTTAGGLAVAIPVMLVYSYLRGKVIKISNAIEGYATDIIQIIEEM